VSAPPPSPLFYRLRGQHPDHRFAAPGVQRLLFARGLVDRLPELGLAPAELAPFHGFWQGLAVHSVAETAVDLWDAWRGAAAGELFVVWTDGPRVCLDAAVGPLDQLVLIRIEVRKGDGPPG
jgi:hypothetical protein